MAKKVIRFGSSILILGLWVVQSSCALAAHVDTSLDTRRIGALKLAATRTITAEDPNVKTPNLTIKNAGEERPTEYWEHILAVLALVKQGQLANPTTRLAEANKLMRYALFKPTLNGKKWQVTTGANLWGMGGQYAWGIYTKTVPPKIYKWFYDYLDADIRTEIYKDLGLLVGYGPYEEKSENHQFTTNCLLLLAYEITNNTANPNYAATVNWLKTNMQDYIENGSLEWGGTTYGMHAIYSIVNMYDITTNAEIRGMAEKTIDYHITGLAPFCVNYQFNPVGVRDYPHISAGEDQTYHVQTLFDHAPPSKPCTYYDGIFATNWRPLQLTEWMFANSRNTTGKFRQNQWLHYTRIFQNCALATQQTFVNNYYTAYHNVMQAQIQSQSGDIVHAATYTITPEKTTVVCEPDRSYGYNNVAMTNGGGWCHGVYGKTYAKNERIRLYVNNAFATKSIENNWFFATNGDTYVGWYPLWRDGSANIGPEYETTYNDPDTYWLRSKHASPLDAVTPVYTNPATLDQIGEAAIFEVGDSSIFTDFNAFKASCKSRTANGSLSWNGAAGTYVTYKTYDNHEIKYGVGDVKLDGVSVDLAAWPRAQWTRSNNTLTMMNHPKGGNATCTDGTGRTVTYNFNVIPFTSTGNGSTPRVAASDTYGDYVPPTGAQRNWGKY